MIILLSLCVNFLLGTTRLPATSLYVVAAENFYGGIAQQVGGSSVKVTNILNGLTPDPHEFQTDAATARSVAQADIVIYNGLGYDDWMERLLGVKGKPTRVVIKVADLIGAKNGDNPHIWYDPKSMSVLATQLAQVLHKPQAAVAFHQSMQPLFEKITALKRKSSGIKVTATEPVFGYMSTLLGFDMLNYDFQLAVMNGTDPNFQQTVNFEKSLTSHTVKILFYSSQVMDPLTQRMQSIAKKQGIPMVGITETQPSHTQGYVNWMLSELSKVEKALSYK